MTKIKDIERRDNKKVECIKLIEKSNLKPLQEELSYKESRDAGVTLLLTTSNKERELIKRCLHG